MILRTLVVGPLQENVYIIGNEGSSDCMIVDPGDDAKSILSEVKSVGLVVDKVVITHGHIDHIGAIADIMDVYTAEYAMHAADLAIIDSALNKSMRTMFPTFRQPPQPNKLLEHGDILKIGGLDFEVLSTPGHSPGSICLYGNGVVFTGDTLFQGSIGRYDLPSGDGCQLMSSIFDEIVVLPPDTIVLPGHGPSSTIQNERTQNPFLTGELKIRSQY